MLTKNEEARLRAREARARRNAAKVGIVIRKSRYTNPEVPGFGGYMLVCAHRNVILEGAHPHAFSLDLDEVEEELTLAPDGTIMGRVPDGGWALGRGY
jgi:hypothetical protein